MASPVLRFKGGIPVKKKILTFKLQHETNQFCPAPADLAAFKNALFSYGRRDIEYHRGRGTDMGGMIRVFDRYPDFEIIHSVSMFANPSDISREDRIIVWTMIFKYMKMT